MHQSSAGVIAFFGRILLCRLAFQLRTIVCTAIGWVSLISLISLISLGQPELRTIVCTAIGWGYDK